MERLVQPEAVCWKGQSRAEHDRTRPQAYVGFSLVLLSIPLEDLGHWGVIIPVYIFQVPRAVFP